MARPRGLTRTLLVLSALVPALAGAWPESARAKDGSDDSGGGSGSSGGSGGNSGSGSSGSNSGSSGGSGSNGSGSNSGSGGSGGSGSSGSGSSGSGSGSGSSGSGGWTGPGGTTTYGHGLPSSGSGGTYIGLDDDRSRRSAQRAEQELARELVATGRAVPFASVMPVVARAAPGRVVDVRIVPDGIGAWTYWVLVLQADGQYRDVRVDARRNRVIEVRRH
ncbi:PepSY domain-containing protein [Prosthecomicrobium sp. N25]|uniref:PepSY domain-containing protein n=1 Tax=Prosthecomicrobium sp. N25 TaxID=3129254 RepID=UPI00307894EC